MGGFFGVASKDDCVFDLFLEPIIIPSGNKTCRNGGVWRGRV